MIIREMVMILTYFLQVFCWPTRLWWGLSVCHPRNKDIVSLQRLTDHTRYLSALFPARAVLLSYTQTPSTVASAEYVNAQELPTDMRSITDRAAQTLLWTELFRGQSSENRFVSSRTKRPNWKIGWQYRSINLYLKKSVEGVSRYRPVLFCSIVC